MYYLACEVEPGVIAGYNNLHEAVKAAHPASEEAWHRLGSSQFIVVKTEDMETVYAVRYSPEDGGSYFTPQELWEALGQELHAN
jgi:hypothetical protein